ncbi:MAG TPA: inositol monophosphatase family protein [Candidatus Angelobacter sp.]|nr:inositol monophosphatase family protein [Candidatus Angelobacter sp.]
MMTVPGAIPLTRISRNQDIERIKEAFDVVTSFLADPGNIEAARKTQGSLTTSLDRDIDQILHALLPRGDEGWLSEETPDDLQRLERRRIWIVDPLDGTREFLLGLPEWCISIGLIEDGKAVAGGVLNPSTGEMFLGSDETGLTVIHSGATGGSQEPAGSGSVLVSRREYDEGKWARFETLRLPLRPVGSVAYRLAQVAARRAAATCTFLPRHEWDVAAGVALVIASGGKAQTLRGQALAFNRPAPRFESLVALSSCCDPSLANLVSEANA